MAKEIYDYQTSTVDGAKGFAAMHAEHESKYPDNYTGEEGDRIDDDIEYDEEPECNCSDPGCPCGGYKIGGL